jgi:hypothetical protein
MTLNQYYDSLLVINNVRFYIYSINQSSCQMENLYSLRPEFLSKSPDEIIRKPITALLSVSANAANTLNSIGIESIFDLGTSILFGTARQIIQASSLNDYRRFQTLSAEWVDTNAPKDPQSLADLSIEILRVIDAPTALLLKNSLGVDTIRELAAWPAYNIARKIINDAYGIAQASIDSERPDELVPIMRKYATEKVQYDILVMDRVLEKPTNPDDPDNDDTNFTFIDNPDHKFESLDITDLENAMRNAKPAIGAVLTYTQSWFPEGLALGQLLHSMALAPGESTRIAIIDWTRSVKASTTEDTNQTEDLFSDINRNRSIGEVTSSVAKEAQNGFSESASAAAQSQNARTTGSAKFGVESSVSGGVSLENGLSGKAGQQFGVSTSSEGTSVANSNNSAWASSKSGSSGDRSLNSQMQQNIKDRTQQAANSARNRRASTVTETSQKERETLSTRVVTNYNHMHALTVQYFEVVQIYKVILDLAKVNPCLFLPIKLITFTEQLVSRYRVAIAQVGLVPEVRALAIAQPSHLILEIPNRIGDWGFRIVKDPTTVYPLTIDLQGRYAAIPLQDLSPWYVGGSGAEIKENYEAVLITLSDGASIELGLENLNETGFTGAENVWQPILYKAGFPPVDTRKMTSISLKKRNDKLDYEGLLGVMLTLNVKTNPVQDSPSGMLIIQLSGRLKATKNIQYTQIFSVTSSFGQTSLLDHLNENSAHYSTSIWKSLNQATLSTLLSSYKLFGKPLINQIDPVPVSITGNYIILRYYGHTKSKIWTEFLEEHELKNPKPSEELIPLPSNGVFAEAVLGRSNSAEKLDITRFWNWQDSPIPILPPEINPLNAGGKANDNTPTTGKLESPLVNIINPPSLPDPAGLAPLYAAIANGNMFRDMSGMANTAALVQAALQAAQAGATTATGAAGTAQQVASNQLTDILKIAAQLAAASMGIPTGGLGGGGSSTPSNTHNLPATPTNKGLNINAAQKLDDKTSSLVNVPNYKPSDAKAPDEEWSTLPSEGNAPSNSATKFPNETAALNGAFGSGSTGGLLGTISNMVKGAIPPALDNSYSKSTVALKKKVIDDKIRAGGNAIDMHDGNYLKELIKQAGGLDVLATINTPELLQFFIVKGGGEGFLPKSYESLDADNIVRPTKLTDGTIKNAVWDNNDLLIVFDAFGKLVSSAILHRPISIPTKIRKATTTKVYDSWDLKNVLIYYNNGNFEIPYVGLGVDDGFRDLSSHKVVIDIHKMEQSDGCIFIFDKNHPDPLLQDPNYKSIVGSYEPPLIKKVCAELNIVDMTKIRGEKNIGIMRMISIT